MMDFQQYHTPNAEDILWGLYLEASGKEMISTNAPYPSKWHPSIYYFDWNKGRTLDNYTLNYISEGTGIYEDATGSYEVTPGTMLIIRKGVWHRYRPHKNTGWTENYICFNDSLATHFLGVNSILKDKSIIYCGLHEEYIDTYYKIFDIAIKERLGFQQVASGLILKLIGYLIAFEKQNSLSNEKIINTIEKAKHVLRENIENEIDIQSLAKELNIAYPYFRNVFKKYTKMSPHQYLLSLKLMRAKELLLNTHLSIKEITYLLKFDSLSYFSKFFKKRTGVSPSEFRQKSLGKVE